MASIGVDVGGTFTDLVLTRGDGQIRIEKVPSQPDRPSDSLLEGLERLGQPAQDITEIAYGTTIATNAVLERKGAATGLICTSGFRDTLEIQRFRRFFLYDLHHSRPQPYVDRRNRIEINERTGAGSPDAESPELLEIPAEPLVARRSRQGIDERTAASGEILRPVDAVEITQVVDHLIANGTTSVAVCLLNSHANPTNERAVAELLAADGRIPYVSISTDVSPLIREFERTSTVVMNAYVRPIVEEHLRHVETRLREAGVPANLSIMQSNGGLISVAECIEKPVKTVFSGPAGGVIGCAFVGQASGFSNVITMDMGGTSCDVSVITDGAPEMSKEGELEWNVPIAVPMIRIETIGAGGGSLVWIDRGSIMKVGPQSAGAYPGPACYGRGGDQPTITDAHLLLGRLSPAGLLGGRMGLDVAAAYAAFERAVTGRLTLTVSDAASGAVRIANAKMSQAIRTITLDRGLDPRDYVLLAFGGAGPLHACEIAAELGIRRVLIPPSAGVLSAMGLATSDSRVNFLTSVNASLDQVTGSRLNSILSDLKRKCRALLDAEGISANNQDFEYSADLRYASQSFEVTVPIPVREYGRRDVAAIGASFHEAHLRLYNHSQPTEVPFLVNVEATGIGRRPKPVVKELPPSTVEPRAIELRQVYMLEPEGFIETPVYDRADLGAGAEIVGPALVQQFDTTFLIPQPYRATVDTYGNILAERA